MQHTYHFMFVNPKTHIGNKHFDHIGVFCGWTKEKKFPLHLKWQNLRTAFIMFTTLSHSKKESVLHFLFVYNAHITLYNMFLKTYTCMHYFKYNILKLIDELWYQFSFMLLLRILFLLIKRYMLINRLICGLWCFIRAMGVAGIVINPLTPRVMIFSTILVHKASLKNLLFKWPFSTE